MDEDHHDRHFPPSPPSPFSLGCGNWTFFSPGQTGEDEEWFGESTDKVKQALLYATLELETTRITAQEKIQRMECEVARLRDLLGAATRERDEAREQAHHALLLERGQSLLLFQNGGGAPILTPRPTPNSGHALGGQFPSLDVVEVTHAANSGGGAVPGVSPSSSSLSFEESSVVVSSPAGMPAAAAPAGEVEVFEVVPAGNLPEKGRLLEAVMKAGPLLQNLMLAGPLPQWRHPPPRLRSIEIPTVSISINSSAAAPAKATLTTTTTAFAEDMKPSFAHHHGHCNSRKRGIEDEEGELVATAEPCGQSPPSSSCSSPKTSSGSSNTRTSSKYQKIGPFVRY